MKLRPNQPDSGQYFGENDMALFSRKRKPTQLVPVQVLGQLDAFGEAAMAARLRGQPVTDPRFSWEAFLGPACAALRGGDRDRAIGEVYEAAAASDQPQMASIGGYLTLSEFDANLEDPRYLEMLDTTLNYMHSKRFSSGHLTGYEARRWVETHGDLRTSFDHIEDVAVPEVGSERATKTMQTGESRLLATMGPGDRDNRFFAERRADGTFIVYSERLPESDSPARQRYDESTLGSFPDMHALLRALGDYLRTPPYWADDDLQPYFPSRRG